MIQIFTNKLKVSITDFSVSGVKIADGLLFDSDVATYLSNEEFGVFAF